MKQRASDRRPAQTRKWLPLGVLATLALAAAVLGPLLYPGLARFALPLPLLAALTAALLCAPLLILLRRQTRRLRLSEARFGRFFEHTTDPILLLDPRGRRIVDANRRAGEMFGYAAGALPGLSIEVLLPDSDSVLDESLAQVRREGSAWQFGVRCVTSEQRTFECETTVTVSPSNENLVLMRIRDVDERLRMQRAIQSLAQQPSGGDDEDFYRRCARELASSYRCRWAFTATVHGSSEQVLRMLAVWDNDGFIDNFDYPLAGSPCADVLAGRLRHVACGVAERFPRDELLVSLGVESLLAIPLVDLSGTPTGVLVVMDTQPLPAGNADQTLIEIYGNRLAMELERRQALLAARQSEVNYRELVDGSAQGILIHRDWRTLYINAQCLRIFGYKSLQEFEALASLQELFDPDELPQLERYRIARMNGTDAPDHYEINARRKDGTPIVLQCVARLTSWNQRPAIQSSYLDITARRKIQGALLESEENFRRLAEGSLEGILIHRHFQPMYLNRAFADMLGYAPARVLEFDCIEQLFPDEVWPRVFANGEAHLQGEDSPAVFPAEMLRRDGRVLQVQVRSTRIQWNGRPAVQATVIDVSEQHQAQWLLQSLHEFSAQQDLGFDARLRALLDAGCTYFDLPIGILTNVEGTTLRIISVVDPGDSMAAGDQQPLDHTLCGETLQGGEPLAITDVAQTSRAQPPCYGAQEVRAYVGIPLQVRGGLYGTLVFANQHPRDRDFTSTEIRILELMARWVAAEISRQLDERDRIDSEQRFRDFAETSADWFWETDQDMRFRLMQGRVEDAGEGVPGQILGIDRRTLHDRYARDSDRDDERYANLIEQRQSFSDMQVQWRRADGSHRILSNSGKPLFDKDGQFIGYRGAGRDVTEQTLAQQAVRHSEARFRDFASIAADWFWETDSELRYTYLSENHARITGRPDDSYLGRTHREIVGAAENAQLEGAWLRMLERQPYYAFVETRRRNDDTLITYTEGKPVFDEAGEFAGYRGIGRDVTDQVLTERELQKHRNSLEELVQQRTQALEQTQKELLQQERLATIGRLVATVSHELRNPLGAVRNAAYYLLRKAPDDQPRWREQLDIINKEINAADKIISDLLETTRAKLPIMQEFELKVLVKEVFDNCRSNDAVEFRYQSEPEDLWVVADGDHLRQVLLNLVTNSVQAIEHGGTVSVIADQHGDCNRIWVVDNGPGFAPEHQEQVFEPLFTTKCKGNGLGLWISREIVERHGGSLQLASDGESGASVAITLPRHPRPDLMAVAS